MGRADKSSAVSGAGEAIRQGQYSDFTEAAKATYINLLKIDNEGLELSLELQKKKNKRSNRLNLIREEATRQSVGLLLK